MLCTQKKVTIPLFPVSLLTGVRLCLWPGHPLQFLKLWSKKFYNYQKQVIYLKSMIIYHETVHRLDLVFLF